MSSSEKRDFRTVFGRVFIVLVVPACLAIIQGCATTEPEIPWNAPQQWEGSPTIPGLPTYH